ncbi:LacI family DNA-binding transcriptional regulator [Granulosicoccus antarcticus]|uniref:HTH-type transcriptional regulator GntR n=1 Tax=Granulosicoccus antarcticus IMCC3135 TaxID=1192854 RepID=A0A2Z2NKX4_9GAMM|nr:LacI family DNA-binding transcriptional regulator [Granulosicoccus antarcticus]ASJ71966.1 HTH-type transcriptional regulator GntR [Granulosicoccus antarcticus IMCC3135]
MRWTSRDRSVTLADVADRAGVSSMTVSKVLRDTGSISPQTRERVLAAVGELGYVKNTLAGQLSSRKSTTIGVVIPSVSDVIFAQMLSGINTVIRPQGLSMLIAESLFSPSLERDTLSSLLSMQPAGLIISGGTEKLDDTLSLLEMRRCPLVSVWDADASFGDRTIGVSHYAAGKMMAEHLLQRGYRQPAYIGSQLHLDVCARHRFDGFRRHLEQHGHSLKSVISEDLPRQSSSGNTLTEQLIQQHPEVTSIFYLNDAMAIGGLRWLSDKGYQCPSQIAVAGFNGTSLEQTIQTRLTTLDVPRSEIGREAAQSIVDLLQGLDAAPDLTIDLTLVQGTTT